MFFWQDSNRRFWFAEAVFLVFGVIAPVAAPARVCSGESDALTPRQLEILDNLESHRPNWEPEHDGAWLLESWDSNVGLDTMLGLPRKPGNAAEQYRLLEEYFPAEESLLREGGEQTRGVEALLVAAEMSECRFSPEYYPSYETSESRQPEFVVIRMYFEALLRRAEQAARAGDAREAERCYQTALACGRHFTDDKSSGLIYVTGLIFKQKGAQAYARFLRDSGNVAKTEAVTAFLRRTVELMRAWTWKMNTALGEMADFACLPAVIKIAMEDKEVFWRKAAVEKLGMLRYGILDLAENAVQRDPAWEEKADEALRAVARDDPEPSVRKLAIWVAMNLNPGNYKAMRHVFPVAESMQSED